MKPHKIVMRGCEIVRLEDVGLLPPMMDETINLSATPHYTICGGAGIIIPDNPSDDSIITCINCGADLGTYSEFKANLGESPYSCDGEPHYRLV